MTASDADVAKRARARLGSVLAGKYRIDRLLGVGGMASVFVATHLRNANCVALKVLHRDLTGDREMRKRFLREGYAANSVGHSGTVRVLDDDVTEDGLPFLVMDLLDGETLDARWQRNSGRLGLGEVVRLTCDLLEVLAAAHAKGVVHRDIKPENLFLTCDSELKVLDFGIARLHKAAAPTATGQGAVFGTPAFMAPEQALGHTDEIDALSDVWAVGATAFSLLSGRYVHDGTTSAEMVAFAATRPAPPLTSVAPWVAPAIAQVIDRALAFERSERWPSAKAMRDAFEAAREDVGPRTKSEADDLTKITPPPAMTMPGNRGGSAEGPGAGVIEAPSNPIGSTVAGVVSNSEARRGRSRQRLAGAAVGGCAAMLLVGGAIAFLRASGPAPGASAFSAEPAARSGGPLPTVAVPVRAPPAASGPESTPWVTVEALPKVTPAASASTAPRAVPAPAPRPRAAASPPSVPAAPSAAPSTPPPPPAARRDPLAPW